MTIEVKGCRDCVFCSIDVAFPSYCNILNHMGMDSEIDYDIEKSGGILENCPLVKEDIEVFMDKPYGNKI